MRIREIKTTFIDDLKSGRLKIILDMVKADDTLSLDIRKDSINIYYRGGSIMRIDDHMNSNYSFSFNSMYITYLPNLFLDINKWTIEKWVNNTPILKREMDYYFHKHRNEESEYQQHVVRDNNSSSISNSTDYFIIDTEYVTEGSRLDMIAIKWLSETNSRRNSDNIKLVFIEMKYGDGAITGNAGLSKHIGDLNKIINDQNLLKDIFEDMNFVLNTKIELRLINGDCFKGKTSIEIPPNSPEIILLLANHDPDKSKLNQEINQIKNDPNYNSLLKMVNIAQASYMGYGLYEKSLINILSLSL